MQALSSTSSLVLLWAQDNCYKSKIAKDYLNLLDLDGGKDLLNRCEKICPYYGEVIKNRKFGVFDLISKCLSERINIKQVVIAGAGLDALGLEITEFYPQVSVFELDLENMKIKSGLLSKINDKLRPNLSFINVDLLDSSKVYSALIENGWIQSESTLLILEGISYYLPVKSIKKLIEDINPDRTIFEFLKRNNEIDNIHAEIAEKVFDLISIFCNCPNIVRYDQNKIKDSLDINILTEYEMNQLEKMRTGINRYFHSGKNGWIKVCLLSKMNS